MSSDDVQGLKKVERKQMNVTADNTLRKNANMAFMRDHIVFIFKLQLAQSGTLEPLSKAAVFINYTNWMPSEVTFKQNAQE